MLRSALLMGVLCLTSVFGAAGTEPGSKSAFDKPTFEAYLRHLLLVVPNVQMTVHDPKPSPVAGLKQVDVTFTFNGNTEDRTYYVSDNGQWVIEASLHNNGKSPFQEDLDKIKTAGAPTMGSPGAPVDIVLYSDFQFPVCKELDQEL